MKVFNVEGERDVNAEFWNTKVIIVIIDNINQMS